MHNEAAGPPPRRPGADWNLLIAVSRGVARFLPRGAMDSGGGAEVEAALRRLTASAGRVTIDLRHVTAIDAAAARALARCVQHSARVGTVVSIVAPRPAVAARLRDAGVPGVRPALHVVPA